MSLEHAIKSYLSFIDRHRGDDYATAERRAVRLPLDTELEDHAAESAVVEAALVYRSRLGPVAMLRSLGDSPSRIEFFEKVDALVRLRAARR